EGAAEAFGVRQHVLLRHERVLEHDLAGDRGAQRKLAFDLRRGQTLGAALDQKAADDAVELGPYQREIRHRRVGDPHLAAGEPVAARRLFRARRHRARVGAVIGLGEAEATDDLARCEFRQIPLALRFAAIGEDRMHHERGLHRHGGAVAGIDPLDLARDQPIGDIAEARAAVLFRDRRAEQAERAHLGDDGASETLLAIVHEHAREQLVLRIAARGLAHHAFFFGELAFEIERILPVEGGVLAVRRWAMRARLGGLRHGMLPGLGVAFSCSRSSGGFKRFARATYRRLAHRPPGPGPYCAMRIFFSLTRRPHLSTSPASTARRSALAPLLISMLRASSLAWTPGAASACLMAASILSRIAFGVPAGANAPIQVATS